MLEWWSKGLVCGCALFGVLTAQAAEFSVGRVDVVFAEEGWREMPLPDQSSAYGGDKDGELSVQAKLFVRVGDAEAGVVQVLVSANSQGMGGGPAGHMIYTAHCASDEDNYREGNEGLRASFAQCLTVTPLYEGSGLFKELAPQLLQGLSADALNQLPPVYTVWSRHAISTGSFVDVRVFTTAPLRVGAAPAVDGLPKFVPPAHVAWGRQLKDAVKSSVHSFSGRLEMPPIQLTTPVTSGADGGG